MVKNNILLDTSTITKFLKRDKRVVAKIEKYIGGSKFFVSTITYYEINRSVYDGNLSLHSDFLRMVSKFNIQIINFDKDVSISCAFLWAIMKQKKVAKLRQKELDILTGGIASTRDFFMMTENEKDFKDIPSIQIL